MRFIITMNMPSRGGTLIHQIIADYPVKDLAELVDELSRRDFILVEEFYRDPASNSFFSVGQVAINYRYVGKIKQVNPSYQQKNPNDNY